MKNIFSVISVLLLLFISSCKSDSGPTSSGGLNGSPPGGSTVTITITQQAGTQGVIFYGSASVAVVLTSYTASYPAQPYSQDYTVTTGAVIPANTVSEIGEFVGVQPGQKWVFTFQGNLGSATGTAFNVTSNYTTH